MSIKYIKCPPDLVQCQRGDENCDKPGHWARKKWNILTEILLNQLGTAIEQIVRVWCGPTVSSHILKNQQEVPEEFSLSCSTGVGQVIKLLPAAWTLRSSIHLIICVCLTGGSIRQQQHTVQTSWPAVSSTFSVVSFTYEASY